MTRRRLLVASGNPGKLRELRALAEGLPVEVVGPDALPGGLPEVEETGATFAANAALKALAAAQHAARVWGGEPWALADDSGLCVDALGGAPGVRSARFAGATGPDRDAANNRLLLERLRGVPPERRGAAFRCAIAVARPGAIVLTAEGEVRGRVLDAPDGDGGFGYDPLFYHVESGASFARLAPAVKAAVGHRGRAMSALRDALATALLDVQA